MTASRRPLLIAVLRYLVPLAAVAYLAASVSFADVLASLALVPPSAMWFGVFVCVAGTAIQAARWGVLLRACGTQTPPRWWVLNRLYWIGGFYNTYVPGGVSGDIVRAVATQAATEGGGLSAALGIVLLERLLGFIATMLLVATGAFAFHIEQRVSAGVWRFMGAAALVIAILVAMGTARLSRYLPGHLGRFVARLPRVQSRGLLALALLMSFIVQLGGALFGHALIAGVSDRVQLADSLVNIPLIGVMQYVPVAIGGAGVREAGFVALYASAHVPPAHAFAAGAAMGVLQYALAALGGLLQWFPRPRRAQAEGPPAG